MWLYEKQSPVDEEYDGNHKKPHQPVLVTAICVANCANGGML
jgi:hypothetical protein